jgi:hypothetical protein
MTTELLKCEYGDKTIQEFVHLFRHNQLNLNPVFQRSSVWTPANRKKLIESIFQGYPLPSIFLYKNPRRGRLVYEVIDGKQRLESILMFQGVGHFRDTEFSVRHRMDGESAEDWDWAKLKKSKRAPDFMGYKLQTVEVSGSLGTVIDLFVRINSTGMKLSSAEKRKAKFYQNEFLKTADVLSRRYEEWIVDNRILSRDQVNRMKSVELVCELLASLDVGRPINKKSALDDVLRGDTIEGERLQKAVARFVRTIGLMKRMFPSLRTTRFANAVDFYSLFLFVAEADAAGCILSDKRRNREAQRLLAWLSNGVTVVREQARNVKGARRDQRMFVDYLLTVQGDTDSAATRERRERILKDLVGGLFARKDSRRAFTLEQRRLIWNSDETKRCVGCGASLTWDNFTLDHVKPHALGGRTTPTNSALMCGSCNSRKGARRVGGKQR